LSYSEEDIRKYLGKLAILDSSSKCNFEGR
jgi:hypothetical protein